MSAEPSDSYLALVEPGAGRGSTIWRPVGRTSSEQPNSESSLTRLTTASAISSGWIIFDGNQLFMPCCAACSRPLRTSGVSTIPGQMQLTRIFRSAYHDESECVKFTTPPFAAP